MLFFTALVLLAAPAEKTVRFGAVTIRMQERLTTKQAGSTVLTCVLETQVDGQPTTKKHVLELSGKHAGCFSLPHSQEMSGFFMVRETTHEVHTLLISSSGDVFDIETLTGRAGSWKPIASR